MKFQTSTKVATVNLNDLINYELSTAKKIRNKLEKLGETSNPMKDAFAGLEKAESLLTQIKDDRGLPRDVVGEQAEAVLGVIQDVNKVLKKLTKRSFGILSRDKLNKEHSNNEELSNINIRLDRVLDQASLHLSRPKGSFSARTEELHAASNITNLTATQVSQVFETKSAFLGTSQQEQQVMKYAGTASAESVHSLSLSEEESELNHSQTSNNYKFSEPSNDEKASATFERAAIYENKVGGKMQVVTGNIGVESGYKSTFNGRSTIHHNTMGADAKIITGDVGGPAAVELMKGFFN
ncbi:hypothetical protein THARTR1_06379 [Trichoderma harzianum]|uniref:NACHT-NTPase and P-loop NTPases N-terminal domain-containing protein n=1 Tax=Trichoderma harzianum TaxID=5544 RepID=A0A2K0U5V6_TRIHA|nr:hypothetical protein THARTR1_06379 [Trichoderma harzianum]